MLSFKQYLNEHIVKRGKKWVVTNSDRTETLGTHDTRGSAVKQLQAIEANKHNVSEAYRMTPARQEVLDKYNELSRGIIDTASKVGVNAIVDRNRLLDRGHHAAAQEKDKYIKDLATVTSGSAIRLARIEDIKAATKLSPSQRGADATADSRTLDREMRPILKRAGSNIIAHQRQQDAIDSLIKRIRGSMDPNTGASLNEQYLSEKRSPAWQRKEGKDPEGGLNKKGVAAYRRQHPGSKLQTAVTEHPSKLKKGSKKAKRRKSFCSRMKGMKRKLTSAKTARDPDSRINKSLRKWNCE